MKLAEAIHVCELIVAYGESGHNAKAIRMVLDELDRLRAAEKAAHMPASTTWLKRECEHEELAASTPDSIVDAIVRKRRADGWELHPVTEYDGRVRTYIFTRPKR